MATLLLVNLTLFSQPAPPQDPSDMEGCVYQEFGGSGGTQITYRCNACGTYTCAASANCPPCWQLIENTDEGNWDIRIYLPDRTKHFTGTGIDFTNLYDIESEEFVGIDLKFQIIEEFEDEDPI